MLFRAKSLKALLLSLLTFFLSAQADAGPIFNVNRIIGTGSVVGTIETDGTLGDLQAVNILDWNLTLNNGTTPFTLFGGLSPNSQFFVSTNGDFTASPTNLLFDFSGAATIIFSETINSAANNWCLTGAPGSLCNVISSEIVTTASLSVITDRSGIVPIANVADNGLTPVPEPATLLLLSTTAVGLGLARWRQRRGQLQD